MLDADAIIRLLDLAPHPEGGYFRETFRDAAFTAGRSHSTAIYFLLKSNEVSRWHRVDAPEVWHWYGDAPLLLSIAAAGERSVTVRLGADLAAAERPQVAVPAGYWQQARSLGDYTLAGCTVAPGFSFAGFELAAPGFEPDGDAG